MYKRCSKCKIEKDITNFSKDKGQVSGLRPDCKDCRKIYYLKTQKYQNKQCRRYKKLHKEQISKYNKEYAKIHEKEIKKRRSLNKKHIYKKQLKYVQNRYKNDFRFKITCNLRSRITLALRGKVKSLQSMFLIGCEVDYLMYHLQSQFKEGMTWDNYGRKGWVVDHIKPCHLFDLSKSDQQKECFHYSNLQPLWDKDNSRKQGIY